MNIPKAMPFMDLDENISIRKRQVGKEARKNTAVKERRAFFLSIAKNLLCVI